MLKFRNIDISPNDPVEKWGVEGILCAFERGYIGDWRKIWKSIHMSITRENFTPKSSKFTRENCTPPKDLSRHAITVSIVELLHKYFSNIRHMDNSIFIPQAKERNGIIFLPV